MLGLFILGVTLMMIFTLVKNALTAKQLSADDDYAGTIELLIPMTARSEFYLEPWMRSLTSFQRLSGRLKIHILIDGHHPAVTAWQELSARLPFVEVNSFLNRPAGTHPTTWMIEQIRPRINSDIVIVGDAELVPTESAFLSLAHNITKRERSYFVLPQTARQGLLGEAILLLNPTLALVSVFGFRRIRRNLSYPLMSIAQGWIGMPMARFREIDFKQVDCRTWKLAFVRDWDKRGKLFALAFGERHLKRYYPEDLKVQLAQLKTYWEELWAGGERQGFTLYLVALMVWSFPFLFFESHPFISMMSIFLLFLYRFFGKIIFQERITASLLHPLSCFAWLGTLVWWIVTGVKTKYASTPRWNRG